MKILEDILGMLVILAVLYCFIYLTPAQMSAEYDYTQYKLENRL